MSSENNPAKPPSGKEKLKDLLLKEENSVCADCHTPNPKWASTDIGVFICLKCGSAHTILGKHISNKTSEFVGVGLFGIIGLSLSLRRGARHEIRWSPTSPCLFTHSLEELSKQAAEDEVLSVIFDDWTDEEIDKMVEVGGNEAANSTYESSLPEGVAKPEPDTKFDERLKFIRSKYELQEFLKPDSHVAPVNPAKAPLPQNLPKRAIDDFFNPTNSSDIMTDKVKFIGLMKIRVMRGTNLAVRDMKTSDPYIIFRLGKQVTRTSVANSNLNPIWNETLTVPVPSDYEALKLEVYDQDTLTEDDIMGVAELNLRPLITSAAAFGDPEMHENMEIGKWPHGYDNALIDDAIVRIVDGKVKHKMEIELQNVESGEIYLELEWLALDR